MNKKGTLGDFTPSICEAAFAEYARFDDSLAKLIQKNSMETREFIILVYVYDQGELSLGQVAQILGLSLNNTENCMNHLVGADLIQRKDSKSGCDIEHSIQLTTAGRVLTSKVLGYQD
jgi:DNA-binding MarR family transcriptional regulator